MMAFGVLVEQMMAFGWLVEQMTFFVKWLDSIELLIVNCLDT